ncbi:unnamed protein product [Rhizoctonia solani]|uniref:Ubiquitin-like domain-containing protein n=1 Tax=Rhizoctonia solani TaxID=456999 RepID=A0A8H3BYV5_9AGAM|nr:unnamed protein product [Rhizoctonia solani]
MSNNQGSPFLTQKLPQFLVAECEGDKATILRSGDYQKTLSFVKDAFPSTRRATQIVLSACLDGEKVGVTEEVWSYMAASLTLIHVELDYSRWERIQVYTQRGSNYYEVDLATETVEGLKQKVHTKEGIPYQTQHLWMSHPEFAAEIQDGHKLIYYGINRERALLALDESASAQHSRNRARTGCTGRG